MKTWRQLEAIAKRQGFRLAHGDRVWRLRHDDVDLIEVASGDCWSGSAKQAASVIRAMCEAALHEMARKR